MQPTATLNTTASGLLKAARDLLAAAPDLTDGRLALALEVFDESYRQMGCYTKALGRMPLVERVEADTLSLARRTAERAMVAALARRPGRSAWVGPTRLVLGKHGDLLILNPDRGGSEGRRFVVAMMALYPEPAAREGRAS